MKNTKGNVKMVPPDGGWGWLIVLGSSLVNFSTRAIEPSFGLLFGDLLKQLNVETTGASVVISTLDSIVNFTGLIVGPLIKKYTYRKVAIFGGLLSAASILLTVPANSMLHILISFGLIGGIGFGLATACTLVGINSYFSKKKGQAVGLSMAGTAFGFMLMPQLVTFLLSEYDFRSALSIIGAVCLHAVVGASLFQPVSWHLKQVVTADEKEAEETVTLLPSGEKEKKHSLVSTNSGKNENFPNGLPNLQIENRKHSLSSPLQGFPRKPSIISNVSLLDEKGNTLHIHEIDEENSAKDVEKGNVGNVQRMSAQNLSTSNWFFRLIKFMDLDLLTDGVYLNILYGLSICIVAEMNFKLIVPFFFMNLGYAKSEIAYLLSIMAIADILARVSVPPILDRITLSRRSTFLFGTIFVGFGRSCLTFQSTMTGIILVLISIGFFRGISLISFQLVLTEYAGINGTNYPSVLGLSMVARGIFIVVLGPLSGYVRDYTKSYPIYIHFQTLLILSVAITWGIELLIIRSKKKKTDIKK